MKELPEIAQTLGYTEDWFALGLIDNAMLELQRIGWDSGFDRNPEHYRYLCFRQFLARHRPLTPEMALALFALGAADQDLSMGGSMMADIIRLPECDSRVLESAMATGSKHLVQLVERRRTAGR